MIEKEPSVKADSMIGFVLNAAEKHDQKIAGMEQSLEASKRLMGELTDRVYKAEKKAEESLRDSLEDPLTKCLNRNYYKKISEEDFDPIRDDGHVAITYIDVNNLKQINDTLGHDEGDRLLQATADLLQSGIRKAGNTVIRLGGDEFIIVSRIHPSSVELSAPVDGDVDEHDYFEKNSFEDSLRIMMERISRQASSLETPISFAYGIAVYDRDLDETPHESQERSIFARQIKNTSKLNNTLIRADMQMLEHKNENRTK